MLVDSHRIVLHGLKRVIDDEKPDIGVVATATCCASAVELAQRCAPDVVVIDGKLAAADEAAVVPELIEGRNTRVLLLGVADSLPEEAALLRGACGLVRRDDTPDVLIKAIKKVYAGELWLERSTTGRLFVELSRRNSPRVVEPPESKLDLLTSREQDVVRTLVTRPGADNKTLAATLHIGEHTLRNHLSRIYDKLGVPNRFELYVFAQSAGLNSAPR